MELVRLINSKLKIIKKLSIDSLVEGVVKSIVCDTDKNAYVVTLQSKKYMMYRIDDKTNSLIEVRYLYHMYEADDQLYFAFDKHNKLFISGKYGLKVYSNYFSSDVLYEDDSLYGPMFPMHGKMDAVLIYSKGMLKKIYANEKLVVDEFMGDISKMWIGSDKRTDEIEEIRASWYADRIMVYLKSKKSYLHKEDEIMALHYLGNHGIGTYMNIPSSISKKTKDYSIQVPNCVPSELMVFNKLGVYTTDGDILCDFENDTEFDDYDIVSSVSNCGVYSRERLVVCAISNSEKNNIYIMIETGDH